MSPAIVFQVHLLLGYLPWLLCFGLYIWPKLKSMERAGAEIRNATAGSRVRRAA